MSRRYWPATTSSQTSPVTVDVNVCVFGSHRITGPCSTYSMNM